MMNNETVLKLEKAGAVKFKSYNSNDAFAALQGEWNTLLKRSVSDSPFASYEWNKSWWDAYHPGDLWILAFRDEANLLIGLAPLFIATEDNGKRVLRLIGSHDVTDYLDILADKAVCDTVYEAFVEVLCTKLDKFDAVDFCNIRAESPSYTILPELLAAKGFATNTERQEVCPIIPLPDNFNDYLNALDKKQRKELERKLRIAEAQDDSVRWYIVDEMHDIVAEGEKFMSLMGKSHPEKAKFLENPQHVAFFRALVPAAMQAGWLQLNFLEVAGEAVAAYCNFDYNNEILVYNSGLDPSKASALSPGIVLLAYNIQYAIEAGRSVFNFLRGNEQYKYRMGGQDTEIFNVKAAVILS
jgi:CelD/BcsL family acetyltransferase involved in cellulose biosynthesis